MSGFLNFMSKFFEDPYYLFFIICINLWIEFKKKTIISVDLLVRDNFR